MNDGIKARPLKDDRAVEVFDAIGWKSYLPRHFAEAIVHNPAFRRQIAEALDELPIDYHLAERHGPEA